MFRKFLDFIKSKTFAILLLLIFIIVLSLLFWFWGNAISFNDFYIFSSPYLRFAIIFVVWLVIFLAFFLKPIIEFFISLKSEKRAKLRDLKKESNGFFLKAKRNFFISLKDAKDTWKRKIKFKKLPLIIIIGEEGAGKSSFINYSNIEYPLSDSLHSYKKFHQSTNNFSLYVSKSGALLDTEGNYFSQEKFFTPQKSDEIPEDDLDKNKEYLIKRNIWRNFLSFLNKNFFYNKLNGIVLIVDTQLFLNRPTQYTKDIIRYLTRRVNDCEQSLNLQLPIYVIFSKMDLIEGMQEFVGIFNEKIANKALGVSFGDKISESTLHKDLQELSQSLFLNFISKNHLIYSLEDKNRIYLFLKQFDNLCSLAKDFLLEIQNENAFKNKSYLRGVYFVSAYQENIPRNFLLDNICEKNEVKKALSKTKILPNRQSYFVKSLLEDIIFKDYSLSGMRSIFRKMSLLVLILAVGFGTYFASSYFVSKSQAEQQKAQNTLQSLQTLLANVDYNKLNINEKADLLANVKHIISVYPELYKDNNFTQYLRLKFSYKGFVEAKELYDKLNEDVLKNTILKEMEHILRDKQSSAETLTKTLFMYKSLFNQQYLNRSLLKAWVSEQWQLLGKYKISKDSFLSGIDDIKEINTNDFKEDIIGVGIATKTLQNTTTRVQRLYILLSFINMDNSVYKIKDNLGFAASNVFAESSKVDSISRIYTKNGIIDFLKNINQNMEKMAEVESWLFGSTIPNDDRSVASVGILKLYLSEYQHKWKDLLTSLQPKQFASQESMLNELSILSKKDNPIANLIKIISTNTNLNDALLLAEAYNIGINASEIKMLFSNLTAFFSPYHNLIEEDSALATAVGLNSKNNDKKIMEILTADIKNIQDKIIDFSNNAQSMDSKIAYSLNNAQKEADDPFVVFANDIKPLPDELAKYYARLSTYAWRVIEAHGIHLLNLAWYDEVYMAFINDIAPLYPFNAKSTKELSMDSFKGFFGRSGVLNKFYDKYLQSTLTKRQNAYIHSNPQINVSKAFLNFMNDCRNLAYLMLDTNDNLKVDFTIKSLDLSADFSHIELAYNDNVMKYDHTIKSNMRLIGGQFSNSTTLTLSVYNYHNSSIMHQKTYSGEWAWYRLLKDNYKQNAYSVIFNNNEKLYFDFAVVGNADIKHIIATIDKISVVESITSKEDSK